MYILSNLTEEKFINGRGRVEERKDKSVIHMYLYICIYICIYIYIYI
jgi:hypothetical protein